MCVGRIFSHTQFGKQSPSTPSGMIIQYMQLDEEVAMQYVQSGMVGLLNALAKDPPPGSSMPNMRTDMRDRLKAVPRLFNPSGVKKMFSLPEWRLISSYNGKVRTGAQGIGKIQTFGVGKQQNVCSGGQSRAA